jgi:hypothetical protein
MQVGLRQLQCMQVAESWLAAQPLQCMWEQLVHRNGVLVTAVCQRTCKCNGLSANPGAVLHVLQHMRQRRCVSTAD